MQDFNLTAHAEKVLSERGIAVEWAEETLRMPVESLRQMQFEVA
jgi:hypothetical protein